MDIITNINHRLSFDEDSICPGGDDLIDKVISESPVKLPEDYIDFLKIISGEALLFYGIGNDGFGIYGVDVGEFDLSVSIKIADSLTDLLVNGIGLDILLTL